MIHGGEIYNKIVSDDFSVNLNPKGCPEQVLAAARNSLIKAGCYPDIYQEELRGTIARLENVLPDNIICGNGASELIMCAIRSINPKEAVIATPGFYGYEHCLNAQKAHITKVRAYDEESGFLLSKSFADYITDKTDVVILANPNNPTGRLVPEKVLMALLEKCNNTGTKLIIDECFLSMSNEGSTLTKYIETYDFLYVIKAFTKLLSVPGIRFGYLVSSKANVLSVKKMLPEWNVSVVAQETAIVGAKHLMGTSFISDSRVMINEQRQYLYDNLKNQGIKVFPSDTNFILMYSKVPLYEKLLDKGILVRDASNFDGLKAGYIRVAVKDYEANKRLIEAIEELIEYEN